MKSKKNRKLEKYSLGGTIKDFSKSQGGYDLFSGLLGSAVGYSMMGHPQLPNHDPFSYVQGSYPEFLALGGTVQGENVEVEGGEIIETPEGEAVEMKGPRHEQGGIPINLPGGTQVFSDRIIVPKLNKKGKKIGTETIADRKKRREEELLKLKDKQKSNRGDKIIQNSLKRKIEHVELEDQKDLELQEQYKGLQQMVGAVEQYAFGTGSSGVPQNPVPDANLMSNFLNSPFFFNSGIWNQPIPDLKISGDGKKQNTQKDISDFFFPFNLAQAVNRISTTAPVSTTPVEKLDTSVRPHAKLEGEQKDFNYTRGELFNMFGNTLGLFGGLGTTLGAFANDVPIQNYALKQGTNKIDSLKNSLSVIDAQEQATNREVQRNTQGARNRMNNSVRGAVQRRAMDGYLTSQENLSDERTALDAAARKTAILQKLGASQDNRQNNILQGEANADLLRQQRRDAKSTALSQFFSEIPRYGNTMAETIDAPTSRKTFFEALRSTTDNNLGGGFDERGYYQIAPNGDRFYFSEGIIVKADGTEKKI